MTTEKTYTVFRREFDESESILAERYLNQFFSAFCDDCGINFGHDGAAWRECFNNWTDSANRNGDICDSAYSDLCPIGARFD
jgi:hypothetical protein